MRKIEKTRRIDEINLYVLILDRNDRHIDRMAFFNFHLVIIRNCISVFYRSHSICHASLKKSQLHKRCLSASAVTDECYVSDFVAGISLHIHTSCNDLFCAEKSPLKCAASLPARAKPACRLTLRKPAEKRLWILSEKPAITDVYAYCIIVH